MAFSNPIVGDEVLIRNSIQSSDYEAGDSGWRIGADGTAEFSGAIFRGTIAGNGYIVNSSGLFLYNGTPAQYTIVGSWASVSGTDEFGNHFPAGLTLYDGTSGTISTFLGGPDNLVYNIEGQEFVGMVVGNFILNAQDDPMGPDLLNNSGALSIIGDNGSITLSSPRRTVVTPNLPNTSVLWMQAGITANGTSDPLFPHGYIDCDFWVDPVGTILKTEYKPSAFFPTPVTWQVPTVIANWSNISMRYRLDAEDNVIWAGRVDFTGTTTVTNASAASILSTPVPAKYRPKVAARPLIAHFTSTSVLKNSNANLILNTDGTVSVQWGDSIPGSSHDTIALNTGDRFEFYAQIPLGNIA